MNRISIVLGTLAVSAILSACSGDGKDGPSSDPATATPSAPAGTSTAAPTEAAPSGNSVEDIAHSVVQIMALDANAAPVWHGSGTVISQDGLILTNAHVVDDRAGEYAFLAVATTKSSDEPPTPAFLAEIAAVDYVLDLAVVRVMTDLQGNAVDFDLPAVGIGDSDSVGLGEAIQILGFPSIGGETITLSRGTVSGFNAQHAVSNRAWIKTDATISGGNSGGLAANAAFEIIGVPTIAGSTADVTPVDCRIIVDTNRDGTVDTADSCVPIGGFINGIRPVALAGPLIAAAREGVPYTSPYGGGIAPPADFDVASAVFSGVVFADGVTADDRPTRIVQTLSSGATLACAFWGYEGMQDGVSWEALWFIDGTLSEVGSMIAQTWIGGTNGNWWVCYRRDQGLTDGLYEVVLSAAGEFLAADSIFVGGSHPIAEVTIQNLSPEPICYVQISPSGALNWGTDRLGEEEMIENQASRVFMVPAATIDMRLLDCDSNVLAEEYESDGSEGGAFTYQ